MCPKWEHTGAASSARGVPKAAKNVPGRWSGSSVHILRAVDYDGTRWRCIWLGGRGRSRFVGSRRELGQKGTLPAVVAVLTVGGRRHHEVELMEQPQEQAVGRLITDRGL